jgi:hypothetical protein
VGDLAAPFGTGRSDGSPNATSCSAGPGFAVVGTDTSSEGLTLLPDGRPIDARQLHLPADRPDRVRAAVAVERGAPRHRRVEGAREECPETARLDRLENGVIGALNVPRVLLAAWLAGDPTGATTLTDHIPMDLTVLRPETVVLSVGHIPFHYGLFRVLDHRTRSRDHARARLAGPVRPTRSASRLRQVPAASTSLHGVRARAVRVVGTASDEPPSIDCSSRRPKTSSSGVRPRTPFFNGNR